MSKNILVTGSKGQLGSEIRELSESYPHFSFFFTDRINLDITDKVLVENFCENNMIDTIINCAAYTAVDKAEEEDKDNAERINHLAVKQMAEVAQKNSISLIHISTDYVFNGNNHLPYTEKAPVSPQSVYGESKLKGEEAMLQINPSKSIIIRTSWVYSSFGNNFVKTMLRLAEQRDELGVIFDQVGSPTYARDLAKTILDLLPKLNNKNVELYHYSNEGVSSWYDFAKAIFEISNIDCRVKPIETKDYPTPAKRPNYSLLNKSKLKNDFSIEIPYWRDALKSCLQILKENR